MFIQRGRVPEKGVEVWRHSVALKGSGNIMDGPTFLKAARTKQRVTYKRVPIKLSANFSRETLQARRDW